MTLSLLELLIAAKNKCNNVLGLLASLLADEIASKDTNPLGPDDEVAADLSML